MKSQDGERSRKKLVGLPSVVHWRRNRPSLKTVPKYPHPPLYMSWLPLRDQEVTPAAACSGVTGHRSRKRSLSSVSSPE